MKNLKVLLHTHTHTHTQKCSFLRLFSSLIPFVLFALLFTSCYEEPLISDSIVGSDEQTYEQTSKHTTNERNLLGESCFANALDPQDVCGPVLYSTETFTDIPGYPGCSFTVQFEYIECLNGTSTIYYVGDFILTSYSCPAYAVDLAAAMAGGDAALTAFLVAFDLKIYQRIELFFLIPNGINPAIYCGFGNLLTVKWVRALCYTYCITGTKNHYYRRLRCGTGCCIRVTYLCYDLATQQVISTTTTTEIDDNEDCNEIPDPIPPQCVFLGLECKSYCR